MEASPGHELGNTSPFTTLYESTLRLLWGMLAGRPSSWCRCVADTAVATCWNVFPFRFHSPRARFVRCQIEPGFRPQA